MDREKVIKGLQEIVDDKWMMNHADWYVIVCENALALLKEQEAVTIEKTKEHGFGVYGGICPKCRNWIQSAHSFCGFCGQAVNWE